MTAADGSPKRRRPKVDPSEGYQMMLLDVGMGPPPSTVCQEGIILDYFAGGGGVSHGFQMALGRSPTVAINHCKDAIRMHKANHKKTKHFRMSVFDVDPALHLPQGAISFAWFSPSCQAFSVARGSHENVEAAQLRGHAEVVICVAAARRPAVIFVENVWPFLKWGSEKDKTLKKGEEGKTFRRWRRDLEALGYVVEYRKLDAADYGAPTHRQRFILIARCDGVAITWPEKTHGPGCAHPFRTAAECLDFEKPACSIFATRKEAKAWGKAHGQHAPKRPLAGNTMARVGKGTMRYVLEALRPFIVPVKTWGGGGNDPRSVDRPMRTITASKGGEYGVVTPVLSPLLVATNHGARGQDDRVHSAGEPLPTITARRGMSVCAPFLVTIGYGENKGQEPRIRDVERPIGTLVGAKKHGLIVAWIAKNYTGIVGQEASEPLATITAIDHHSIVLCSLTKFYGTSVGQDLRGPLPTISAQGQHLGLVTARCAPLPAGLAEGALSEVRRAPLAGTHIAETARFIADLYKDAPHPLSPRIARLLDEAELWYVTIDIVGETYLFLDILLRMPSPEELALCQGFPADYVLTGTDTSKIARIGNSVPPPLAAAVIRSNAAPAQLPPAPAPSPPRPSPKAIRSRPATPAPCYAP